MILISIEQSMMMLLGKIFLCGDLNSRTGNKSDYVETCNLERYIDTVLNDLYEDNVDVRVSEDNTTNAYGHRLSAKRQVCVL